MALHAGATGRREHRARGGASYRIMLLRVQGLTRVRSATGLRCLSGALPDPYAILGVHRNTSADELRQRYLDLARKLHPDVTNNPADAANFAAIVEAYESVRDGGCGRRRSSGRVRGVRIVDGILVASIEALKRDPAYDVHTIRLRLEEAEAAGESSGAAATPADVTRALSAEAFREVCASEWDSVADVKLLLLHELRLGDSGEPVRGRGSRDELIFGGQVLGEHLFLADYGVTDGCTLHFARRRTGDD